MVNGINRVGWRADRRLVHVSTSLLWIARHPFPRTACKDEEEPLERPTHGRTERTSGERASARSSHENLAVTKDKNEEGSDANLQ